MAVLQDININVHGQPSEKRLQTFLRLSQNENGRMINFRVLGPPLPSGCTATFSGTKPDGNVYSKTGTVAGNFVIIQEDMQMTAVAGVWDAKLDIINGSHNIMTALIRVVIDADVVDPDAIASDSQLQGLVAEAKYYAEHARTDAYGSPLTAPTKAQMTDHTRVYVYTGSEPNMVAGNWYYWNGSAWTSGGVYNAVAVQTDKTLTVRDKAADGKATGDAIDALKEDLFKLNGQDIGFIDLSDVEIIDGSYLDANGETASNASFRLSDYIEIPWGTKNVVLNRLIWVDDTSYPQTHVVWFYDSEKTLLGTGYGEIRTNTTLIATPYPSAKYMRANFSKAHAVPFILRNATDALRCSRYTFAELGITDLDDLERNYIYLRSSYSGSAVAHVPYNNWIGTVMTINAPNQLSGSIQLAYSSTGRFHYRVCWGVNNTWTDWVEFLQKSNLNYAMGELGRYTGAFTQREQLTAPIYLQPNHKYLVKFFNNDRTGSINVFPTLNTSNYKRVMPWMDEAVITTADDDTVRYLNFYNPSSQLDRVDIAVYELDSPLICVEEKPRLYRVNKDEREGDFTSITECFLALKDDDRPKIIEIWEGDYDIYQEYVDADVPVYTGDNPSMDYFDYCVWVPKNTHVIGKGIVRLKWMPDPSEVSITAMQTRCVSPLNVAGSATIENLEVYCQNGRYVLHNDALGKPEYTGAKQHYINCRFYKYEDAIDSVSGYRYGFGHTTGFGIDRSMSHIYENCLFKNFYTGRAFYGHSRGTVISSENHSSDITLKDCVIETEGTTSIKFGNGPNNMLHIRTTFSGCFVDGLIDCVNESGTPTYPNAYDIRFLNCGNVRLHIADEDNRYAPSAYNTVLSME